MTGSVEVTGGVDTHKDTHTAAVVDAAGRVLGTASSPTTAAGYARAAGLAALASASWSRSGSRAPGPTAPGWPGTCRRRVSSWSRSTGPDRKTRRWQGKSDPVDAEAAARAALAGRRYRRAEGPRRRGSRRCARCGSPAAARWPPAPTRQRQMKSLIVTAPDPLRAQLRGLSDAQAGRPLRRPPPRPRPPRPTRAPPPCSRCARWPAATSTCPPRSTELDALIAPLVTAINPALLDAWPASAPTSPGNCWSPPGTTPTGCAPRRRSPCSAAPRRSPPPPGAPTATGSTAAATAKPTPRSTASCCAGCAGTPAPAPTPTAAPPKA